MRESCRLRETRLSKERCLLGVANSSIASDALNTEVAQFGIHLDDAQRKHSQKMGTRNEAFAREMLEFAQQRPELVPAGISLAALQRDLAARDQVTPLLFQLKALTRTLEDTQMALGVDLYNGTRAMYKAVKPIAAINGAQHHQPDRSAVRCPGTPEDGADSREHGFRRAVIHR